MNEVCTCGHLVDEHEPRWGECTVHDCPCFQFEVEQADLGTYFED